MNWMRGEGEEKPNGCLRRGLSPDAVLAPAPMPTAPTPAAATPSPPRLGLIGAPGLAEGGGGASGTGCAGTPGLADGAGAAKGFDGLAVGITGLLGAAAGGGTADADLGADTL